MCHPGVRIGSVSENRKCRSLILRGLGGFNMAEGSIVTFYSYKGGVGRSFAMANVGVALASWGYRILCVDWDLEAPGLHKYLSVKEPTSGVVELISSLTTSRVEVWKDHVRQVSLANGARFDLLAAGGQ